MLIVQKFGGTSVATVERIRNVARKVKREREAGHRVAVVVSAMSGVTNQLVGYVNELSPLMTRESWAEYDQVVSSGEQVTCGLLALCLQEMGIPARSFAGWQVPLLTDESYGKARIREIPPGGIHDILGGGMVVVMAGFQGVSAEQRITTLGRGGSDTSAVALAAALVADRCDIYTDVDGVYTTDPRIVPRAQKLHRVAYEEMLEMASLGAKVLQTRSVEMAMNHRVKTQVLSSFTDQVGSDLPGTLLVDEEDIVEQQKVTGIAYSRDEARISLTGIANVPGMSAQLFGPLADAGINVDMIVQNVTEGGGETDITFTVPRGDAERAIAVVEAAKGVLAYRSLHTDKKVAKISAVGIGMRSHSGIASTMFRELAAKGVNIIVITTSEIKISVLISEDYLELAVRGLHTAFGLDGNTQV